MNRSERSILAVTCFGHFISHFNMLVFPALVLPLVGRLGLSVSHVLDLSFWMYLLFGLTALPWGLAADRWGAKNLLMIFFLGAGLCGLAAAMWMDSPGIFSLALAGIGLFSGIYHPAGLGLISKGVSKVSLAMGYNGMFGNLGLAMAPLVTGLVNWLAGPRAAYLVLAAVNFTGIAMMLLLPVQEAEADAQPKAVEKAAPANQTLRPFLVLLAAMMLGGLAYRGSSVIMPTFFELQGRSVLEFLSGIWSGGISGNLGAAAITCLVYLLGVPSQYLGGRVGERFELRRAYLFYHALSIPAALLTLWVAGAPVLILVMVYMFFLLGMQPIENTLVSRFTPANLRHAAFGAKFIFTFGVGSAAVWVVGWIQGAWGLQYVFPALGLVSAALVSVILVLIRVSNAENAAQS